MGFRVTVPEPAVFTVSVKFVVTGVKVAVTDLFAFMVTVVGLALPVTAPLQPENTNPDAGEAVKVMTVPEA